MLHVRYLIIGAGMTADAAIAGIREVDAAGPIGLIGAEPHPPYNRPPLSKALWKGEPLDSIWRKTDPHGIALHLGRTAKHLDAAGKTVTDDQGVTYGWEKLLLATGGTPRRLPFGGDRILYFRTLDDYQKLRAMADQGRRFAVIGGGFIGSEIAAALAMNGKEVVMLFPGAGIGGHAFPADLSAFLNEFYRQKGVDVRPGETASGLAVEGERPVLETATGQKLVVDGIVAGIGITPTVDLAEAAGLAVENGIVVNERLQTTHSDIYAAGDAAAFHNPALGRRIRVEHEDNANTMGRAAGRNMAGADEPYRHLPYFYSDLFDLGYEAVGDLDAGLEVVSDWKEPFREGVVYYLRDKRVRGVLLWNTWGQVNAARDLIASHRPVNAHDLKGRLAASR